MKGTSLFLLSVLFFPHVYVSYTLVHHFYASPSSSLSTSCTPLQPARLPSKRRRGLASVWWAQGSSVCTQFLLSWANSSAAAVWAKPGALIATNAPLQEQVRPPAMSDIYPVSMKTKGPKHCFSYLDSIPCQTQFQNLKFGLANQHMYTSVHLMQLRHSALSSLSPSCRTLFLLNKQQE